MIGGEFLAFTDRSLFEVSNPCRPLPFRVNQLIGWSVRNGATRYILETSKVLQISNVMEYLLHFNGIHWRVNHVRSVDGLSEIVRLYLEGFRSREQY